MPPTGAPDDLAYATALAAACQRILVAPDAAALWRTVVDEALALIAADGVAVVSYTEGFWQTLAVRPSDSAPGDWAVDGVIEMLVRQSLFQQPFPDDSAEVAAWDGLGERAVLVARIEGSPRQPLRLVWYATAPAFLSPYAKIAEAIAHHASLALKAALERDNLTRAMAARHRVGLAQGILIVRRQITADQAFALLKRESQNTHVKLRAIAQTVIQTGDLPLARRVRSDDIATEESHDRC
jgi:ANTAR domain-containing protein